MMKNFHFLNQCDRYSFTSERHVTYYFMTRKILNFLSELHSELSIQDREFFMTMIFCDPLKVNFITDRICRDQGAKILNSIYCLLNEKQKPKTFTVCPIFTSFTAYCKSS